MERVERRGSIARAFGRIRTAMKRRRPIRDDKPVEVTTGHSTIVDVHLQQPITRLDSTPIPSANLQTTTMKDVCLDQSLEPDADEFTDNDEPLLPMASNRPGISNSKARDLFSRYGLLYRAQEHTSEQEPPRKLRRVERPIRIRIHWTCHACKSRFGMRRTCAECGHQRCSECPRLPPKRVQDVLENGRCMMELGEISQQELPSSAERSGEPSPNSAPSSTPDHSALPSPSPLLALDPSIDDDGQVEDLAFDFSFYTRPSAAIRLFGQDHYSGQIEERLRLSKANKCSFGSSSLRKTSHGEVPMMRAVQRVYRKPRQRVRYTCERCATLLVEGDRCRECDHNRFVRNPPKRTPPHYDADILQIVANRLAAHGGGGFTPQQGLTG